MTSPPESGRARIRLQLYGRVQGVGFRAFARELARDLSLAGYVRNRPDGSVEVVAEGPAAVLAVLRRRLEQGPPYGDVQSVTVEASEGGDLRDPFEIRW
ncbi:MAG TPA: acylphosphatase [Longimicrobiales bacterium]|nr:acylphosphatase [Longimicrobiales bacterium]